MPLTCDRAVVPRSLVLLAGVGALALPTAAAASSAPMQPADALSGDLTVFAAASLTDSFEAIGEAFREAHPHVELTFSFAGSSDLVGQITEGAPADVFASADLNNMGRLVDADAAGDEPATFATNTLEIVVEADNPQGITGLEDLADPDLIVVSCAPEVPIGAYTQQVLDAAGVNVEFDSYEENVRAVSEKVQLGEADAGIVYATDVIAAGDAAEGVEIPPDVNVIAEYPIATTTDSTNPAAAAAFVEFVLGDDGQEILGGFGFGSPAAAPGDTSADTAASVANSDPATTMAG